MCSTWWDVFIYIVYLWSLLELKALPYRAATFLANYSKKHGQGFSHFNQYRQQKCNDIQDVFIDSLTIIRTRTRCYNLTRLSKSYCQGHMAFGRDYIPPINIISICFFLNKRKWRHYTLDQMPHLSAVRTHSFVCKPCVPMVLCIKWDSWSFSYVWGCADISAHSWPCICMKSLVVEKCNIR